MHPFPNQNGQQAPSGVLARIPSKDTLDHVKVAIEVLLLLLAVPWILRELATNPGRATRRAAEKHAFGAGPSE